MTADTGEPGTEYHLPTTEAGARLFDLAPKLWEQPEKPSAPYADPRSHSRPVQIEVRQMVLAIEAEARAQATADEADRGRVEALRRYARHEWDCSWNAVTPEQPCSCGLDDLLLALTPAAQPERGCECGEPESAGIHDAVRTWERDQNKLHAFRPAAQPERFCDHACHHVRRSRGAAGWACDDCGLVAGHVGMSQIVCVVVQPTTQHHVIRAERSPDGRAWCACGFVGKHQATREHIAAAETETPAEITQRYTTEVDLLAKLLHVTGDQNHPPKRYLRSICQGAEPHVEQARDIIARLRENPT